MTEAPTRFPIPLAADQSFTGNPSSLVAISPDGSDVVYFASNGLWLRPVDQLQAAQVPGTEGGGRGPFFSPDGQSIGFYTGGQLKKVAVSGGAPVTLADVGGTSSEASWGGDDMILYVQPDGIWQVPGEGGTPALLIPVGEGEDMHGPQMLPGGEWVLFTVRAITRVRPASEYHPMVSTSLMSKQTALGRSQCSKPRTRPSPLPERLGGKKL